MLNADALIVRRQAVRQLGAWGLAMVCGHAADEAWALEARPEVPVPPEVAQKLPQARLQGEGRFRYFGFHVYDARLWVPLGFDARSLFAGPFALSLIYARKLKARDIAERSIEEMRRQATLGEAEVQRWLPAMTSAFADVRDGDRLTGLYQPGGGAAFFLNGQVTRAIVEPRFATLFFGIWLSPATSAPALRRELLGA